MGICSTDKHKLGTVRNILDSWRKSHIGTSSYKHDQIATTQFRKRSQLRW